MVPRPVTKVRPDTLGYQLLNTRNWLQDLVKDLDFLCLKHFFNIVKSRSTHILRHVYFSKKHDLPCLRIYSIFFTQIVFAGGTEDSGKNPRHKDKED